MNSRIILISIWVVGILAFAIFVRTTPPLVATNQSQFSQLRQIEVPNQAGNSVVYPNPPANSETSSTVLSVISQPETAAPHNAPTLNSAKSKSSTPQSQSTVETVPISLPAEQLIADTGNNPLSESEWNINEFDRLRAPSYEKESVLDSLPIGSTITPPEPLNIDELLSADQSLDPVGYSNLKSNGQAFKLNTGDPALAGKELDPGQIQIDSTDFLEYDEERSIVYGHGRVVVRYGIYKITADRIMIDTRLKEIQAYGSVELTSKKETIKAESMWINTENSQGVAYNGQGHTGDYYFLSNKPLEKTGTTIRQISKDETVLKDSSFTTCDFPVPHYRFSAKEFTLIGNDRVFARNVVLYVREKPVLWLPFFTRSLKESNPWGFSIGSGGQTGMYARIFYDFKHSSYGPSNIDDSVMVKSSDGKARLRLDFFSKRGFAQGIDYGYNLDYGKHIGSLFAYRLSDSERDITGENNTERYYLDWFHRTKISDELDWFANVDYASDPDIFFDTLDRVRQSSDPRRGRLSERSAQTGFEWTTDDFFAGLLIEMKDRIGRDRVSNYAEFRDDDFDFDRRYNDESFFDLPAPGFGPDGRFYSEAGRYLDESSVNGNLDEGLSSSRFGRVSERLPQIRVASNKLRLGALPLWYHLDFNAFNNLDKGLNVVNTRDDSFVHGFDLYQSLTHLTKFSERFTWTNKLGLGVGVAERGSDSYNLKFPAGTTFPFIYDGQVLNGIPLGLTFVDKDTFLVGKKKMSLSDVEPGFVYGDLDSRFNARISDSLSAFVRYRYREGSGNNIGQFYENIGARKTMDDLYAFKTPENWIEAGLTYNLSHPNWSVNLNAGKNLQGKSDITPSELMHYGNLGLSYANLKKTFLFDTGVGLQQRQLRDPSDPFAFQQDTVSYYASGSYMPVHQRHWARLSTYFINNTKEDPLYGSSGERRSLDTRNETILDATIGKKIGTKYLVELRSRIRSRVEDNQDTYVNIERDFHDLVAGLQLGVRQKGLSKTDEEATENNFQVRLNVRFKPASQKGLTPQVRTGKLYSNGKNAELAREIVATKTLE